MPSVNEWTCTVCVLLSACCASALKIGSLKPVKQIKGTGFTDIALKSTQQLSFDRFTKKMKKELDKL
jgi:hypothetical protein